MDDMAGVDRHEELDEPGEAVASGDKAHAQEELGDLLFTLVNGALVGIDPESAWRAPTTVFSIAKSGSGARRQPPRPQHQGTGSLWQQAGCDPEEQQQPAQQMLEMHGEGAVPVWESRPTGLPQSFCLRLPHDGCRPASARVLQRRARSSSDIGGCRRTVRCGVESILSPSNLHLTLTALTKAPLLLHGGATVDCLSALRWPRLQPPTHRRATRARGFALGRWPTLPQQVPKPYKARWRFRHWERSSAATTRTHLSTNCPQRPAAAHAEKAPTPENAPDQTPPPPANPWCSPLALRAPKPVKNATATPRQGLPSAH